MSNDFWPTFAQPARNRVLVALARHVGLHSVRDIARLAHVSPSTALRVTDQLVVQGILERKKVKGGTWKRYPSRDRLFLQVKPSQLQAVKVAYGKNRSRAELLDYIAHLDAPIWLVTAQELASRGVTRRVKTFVVMPRSWVARFPLPHDLPVAVFERSRPLELATGVRLDWTNMLVALLKVDIVAASQFYDALAVVQLRERRTLLRRIHSEKLLDEAKRAKIDLDNRRR
jgi:hypothetical protein